MSELSEKITNVNLLFKMFTGFLLVFSFQTGVLAEEGLLNLDQIIEETANQAVELDDEELLKKIAFDYNMDVPTAIMCSGVLAAYSYPVSAGAFVATGVAINLIIETAGHFSEMFKNVSKEVTAVDFSALPLKMCLSSFAEKSAYYKEARSRGLIKTESNSDYLSP